MKMNLKTKYVKFASSKDGYSRALVELGNRSEKIIVLSADLKNLTGCADFAEEFPERFIQVGSGEQNMAGLASGISMQGYIPFISSFATLSPGKNWDQIRSSICFPKLNVKIISSNAGLSAGHDGAIYQALEDIAIARVLPNMTVIAPADAIETEKAIILSAQIDGPVYIRFSSNKSQVFTKDSNFEINKANILNKGRDVAIIGCGPILYEALLSAKELLRKYKISAEVINCHTIKPLDIKTICSSAKKTGAVVCIEEHQVYGGLGSAISELLSERCSVPMGFIGMPDSFGESGESEELMKKYGITKEKIISSVLDVIKKK